MGSGEVQQWATAAERPHQAKQFHVGFIGDGGTKVVAEKRGEEKDKGGGAIHIYTDGRR